MEALKRFLFCRVNFLICSDLYLVIMILVSIIFGLVCYKPISSDVNILDNYATHKFSSDEISEHNKEVISTLQERENSIKNYMISQDDGLRATRSIFAAIITALIVFIFRDKKDYNGYIYAIMMVLVVIFFFLDVHLEDLKYRTEVNLHASAIALDSVLKHLADDNTFYYLNYTQKNKKIDSLGEFGNRIPRKVHSAIQLKFDRIIIYAIPFLLFYLLLTKKYRKEEIFTIGKKNIVE